MVSVLFLTLVVFCGLLPLNSYAEKKDYAIKIGAILPLTGNASLVGEYVKNGIDLAVDEINSKSGIKGKKIVILYGDSKNDPKEGISIFNKFISLAKVPTVISAMTSVTQAVTPIADSNKIVILATSVSASGITENSPWLFRLFVTAENDATTMANFASDKLKYKRLGVLHVYDDFGLNFSKVFTSTFENRKKGNKVVFSEGFDKKTSDYRSILAKVKKKHLDAIYILGYDNNLGLLPKQMREIGITIPILSIGTIAQPNVIAQAGKALDGTYFTTTEFSADNPLTQEAVLFVEKYKAKYNKTPTYFSAFAYDSIMIVSEAIKNEGYSSDTIQKGLQNIKDFKGVTGVITIKPNRDADFKMVVKTIKKGIIEDVE